VLVSKDINHDTTLQITKKVHQKNKHLSKLNMQHILYVARSRRRVCFRSPVFVDVRCYCFQDRSALGNKTVDHLTGISTLQRGAGRDLRYKSDFFQFESAKYWSCFFAAGKTVRVPKLLDGAKILPESSTLRVECTKVTDRRRTDTRTSDSTSRTYSRPNVRLKIWRRVSRSHVKFILSCILS